MEVAVQVRTRLGRVAVMPSGRGRKRSLTAIAFVLLALLAPMAFSATAGTAKAAPSDWSPPRTVYIPETGQTVDGVFLDQWRFNGGINAYGYPISPEITENGRIVQYYQYARFEYVPDDPDGNVVQLGKIGAELRPHMVMRGLGGVTTAAKTSMAIDAARASLAWLPLKKQEAKRENTETWRYVAQSGHSVANGFKDYWEATGEADYLGYPLTEEYKLGETVYQVFERGQLAWREGSDPFLVAVGTELAARYKIDTAARGQGDLPIYDEQLFIEPEPEPEPVKAADPSGERWIEINLSSQYMRAWQGDTVVIESYVSTGRPGFDTPPGTFYVNSKIESQTMEGVLGGEYYNVPDVPYVMYFTGVGHAIHGAYWHYNFGAVMSHGCVNLPVDVAAFVYSWSSVGTRVEITY